MQFVYFIPRCGSAGEAAGVLAARGIDRVGGAIAGGPGPAGPDGGRGFSFRASAGPQPDVPDDPARVRWIPIRSAADAPADAPPDYWIGTDRESPPTPAELLRDEFIPGRPVRLADGAEWEIPIARRADADAGMVAGLPVRLSLDDDGRRAVTVVDRYRELWDCAAEAWNESLRSTFGAAPDVPEEIATLEPMTFARAVEICGVALRANYRAGEVEAAAAGLLDSESVHAILKTIADVDAFVEMAQKKTASPPTHEP